MQTFAQEELHQASPTPDFTRADRQATGGNDGAIPAIERSKLVT